ncbi:uncharacterized protein LOC133176303 [Saccostrea echinata]|uniref:uncharacterized protein LOC133176303 n=1 Tax=Saccostrea echinata TaxID=191078 RepID=UPI002A81CF9B|nr:uncharacterized protein LOC133176303 [Saccostrea echinata]
MRNSSSFVLVSATLCVYFSVQLSSVTAAKCKGPWANHMCFGGNGKRSWSPSRQAVDKRADDMGRTLLKSVLLKRLNSFPPEEKYYNDLDSFYPLDSDLTEKDDSSIKEQEIREYLKEQLLKREMAALTEDDEYLR